MSSVIGARDATREGKALTMLAKAKVVNILLFVSNEWETRVYRSGYGTGSSEVRKYIVEKGKNRRRILPLVLVIHKADDCIS